jgi:DNA-binding transcriptional regulator LsrR (DeoR family)
MGVGFSAPSDKVKDRVWQLHLKGLNNRTISDRLGISDRTVARAIQKRKDEDEAKRKENDDDHHDEGGEA